VGIDSDSFSFILTAVDAVHTTCEPKGKVYYSDQSLSFCHLPFWLTASSCILQKRALPQRLVMLLLPI